MILTSTTGALHDQCQECLTLEKELLAVVLDETQDEKELDAFFDEVTNANRGKFIKIHFFLDELEKKNAKPFPVSQNQSLAHTFTLCSTLPDLELLTFDGQITDGMAFGKDSNLRLVVVQPLNQSGASKLTLVSTTSNLRTIVMMITLKWIFL